ncbi:MULTISPECIES: SDR family NAD(P)-dependent oxidoreductase [Nocardia]|uniref:SDR family NAD(P)-dependent oxidoreductase n=1 Tax=Nocardia TaxID=1817 RepID=UPI000D690E2E|nr:MULTISPECIES: SDR family NAD(P)-dependent oxidoreductase [Nocardia]
MSGRVDGKVALITGAARGQGRSHAVRLAKEGADIIAIDICGPVDETDSASISSTLADLAATAELVKQQGRRVVTAQVDIRDGDALERAVDDAVQELGRLDVVVANAGIGNGGRTAVEPGRRNGNPPRIDLNRSGVWKTVKAAVPQLLTAGGGSIVLTGPLDGLEESADTGLYSASKPGVVRMMRSFALELAPHSIRCNSIHPAEPGAPIFADDQVESISSPNLGDPDSADLEMIAQSVNRMLVGWNCAPDISDAVVFLASNESAYVTGIPLNVDVSGLLI